MALNLEIPRIRAAQCKIALLPAICVGIIGDFKRRAGQALSTFSFSNDGNKQYPRDTIVRSAVKITLALALETIGVCVVMLGDGEQIEL
jgi:hypothetical protein